MQKIDYTNKNGIMGGPLLVLVIAGAITSG